MAVDTRSCRRMTRANTSSQNDEVDEAQGRAEIPGEL
jgi:hypothetical protein